MKRNIFFVLVMLLFGISLFGCADPKENGNERTESMSDFEMENQANMQFMMETYGFSQEELQGVDIGKLMEDYQLRSLDYTPEEIRQILEEQGDMYAADEKTQLYRIFSVQGRRFEEEDANVIRIAIYINAGTGVERMIFDLEKGVFYVDDTQPHALGSEQIDVLKELPVKWEIAKWEQHTQGKEESSTGNYSWKLIFELEDHEYVVYDGYTQDMSCLPENFVQVRNTLISVAKSDSY